MTISRREFVAATAGTLMGPSVRQRRTLQARMPPEDGYKLWLRYAPPLPARLAAYRSATRQLIVEGTSATARVSREEILNAVASMLGTTPSTSSALHDGMVLVGTPASSPLIRRLGWQTSLDAAGAEGFVIRSTRISNRAAIVIASIGETGALYGAFHFLRLLQTAQPIERLDVTERPKVQLRMLNHWDNLDGTIERGYAGRSLWQWDELPGTRDLRYTDYARVNASIGVNGAVINNVNADVRVLSHEYLVKVAALADVWRPYGVRVYLAPNFAAPLQLRGATTADPLDATVASWWKAKADEIYALIPDFGGFLVKANSEGQPGPKDYRRSHADGANMMADALAPHGGRVIWRAFVYDEDVDADRTKRAYIEFTRLDGQFKPNVIIQVKNGPLDFMPREPFHPLFGAMKKTPVMAEVQATQEYTGQATHLVYLGTMWQEFLQSDTYANGKGCTVGKTIAGEIEPYGVTGFAAVVNPGLDRTWCGHHFSQSNWYAAGRFAWDPALSAAQIADEWARMTFTTDAAAVGTIRDLMMRSREIYVNYTMPLGLHHLIGGDHYAPMPENARAARADQTAVYYHRASPDGIGFDRTSAGSNAVGQYYPPVREMFEHLNTCPETLLLWFHRCPWDYRLTSGKTLWDGMCEAYAGGVAQASTLQTIWRSLAGAIDARRHAEVDDRLTKQVADAATWRRHILQYFQSFSGRPIPT